MIRANLRLLLVALLGLALAGCMRAAPTGIPVGEREAIAARMMGDIRVLASDEFGGRKPGTIGEARTLSFITQRMQEVGLVSGTNDPGSAWRAPVELVSSIPQSSRITLSKGRRTVVIAPDEAAAYTPRRRELAQGGPATGVTVYFVGRDPEAITEEQAAGAIIVLLADTGNNIDKRKALFAKRASAVLSVVTDKAALAKVMRSYADERVQLAIDEEDNALNGFITEAALSAVLGKTRWQDLRRRGTGRSFTPVTLDLGVNIEATSQRREFVSHNLLGKIPGKQADAGAVLLLAHWDHLGECGPPDAQDRICNGAVDNASGVAADA
jgi:aminopeptidase YwaD